MESIDQQTDKSDLTDPETNEADPAVQQIIESDITDNNSSNDTDDSENESQQQQQHGPMIQDLGPEDEIHEEQGPGQEYQVEEPVEGPEFVQRTAPQQAVPQLPGGQAGNVVIKHFHHYHSRTLHYHVAPVYHGSVIKGDIIGSKSEIKDANIGAVGGSQPPAIGGPGGQAALAWLGGGASGSSQVPAIGDPEQRPALPWHEEGERGALHPGSVSNQPLALLALEAQISSPGNEQLEEIEATVPTNEPEVIDSIKPKKKANRAGIPTASNPEIQEAFPLIPPEPSNRRDVASGARPKTTDKQGSQPPAIGGPEGQAALAWLGEGASGSSQVPAIGGPEQRPALPWHGEGERGALHPGGNQPLALPAPEAQISSSGNEQPEGIEATVPTNEPEILDPIKPKKKSKKRPNRAGSNRDPEPVPTSRSSVERRFIDEETLNANVTTPKVVGIPTASNPETQEAFPLIPPEPSNRRNENETSGARPKTTDQQSRPTAGQIEPRKSLPHPEQIETRNSRDSQSALDPSVSSASHEPLIPGPRASLSTNEQLQAAVTQEPANEQVLDFLKPEKRTSRKDRPSVRFSPQDEVEERSFVGEDTDVTIPKAIGSPTSPSPIYDRDLQQAIPSPGRTEHQHRRNVNIQSGARPKTTGAGMRVRYLPEQDETSEDETSEGIDSENELSDIIKDFIKYKKYVSEEKSLFTRKSERRKSRDRKTTHQAPTTSRSRSTGSRRQRNERQFSSTNRVRSKSADARYLWSLDEASGSGDCGESIHVIDPAKESDSESELSSIAKDFVAYIKHKTNPKFSRQINKSYFEDRSFTNNSSQECQVNLDRERDGMNPTDQTQPSGRELRVKERDTSDKHLQTDDPNYNKEYETSVLKMTEIYKKERDIQTLKEFKPLLPFIEIFWTKILFKMTMAGYNRPSGAPEKLWSNFTDEITCDRGSEITMKPYISKIKDIMKLGEEFISSGKYIHAIVAFYAAAKLHRQSGKGNESVKDDIWTCFDRAGFVAEKMQKSVQTANVAKNHVIPIMHEMTDFLKPIHSQSQFAEELENKSKEFVEEKKFISATVALYVAAKLHKKTTEGDDSARGVLSCIEQISLVMEEMIKQKQTKTLSHVISLITEMIDFFELIEITNYSQFINEIESKAKEFDSEKKFIQSVVSFYVAAKLHGLDNKGDQSVRGIEQSVNKIRLVVEKMTKQHSMRNIVKDHVIPLMHELLEIVQTIKGSTQKVRVEGEACCLFNIGLCYDDCDEYQEYANINNSAIILIERELEEPQTYQIYGLCLNNAGAAYGKMGNIEKAVELYKMSLEAKMNAEDHSCDKDKNESIELTRNNLRIVEFKLPK
uniref:uncharacterized protein LOC120334034 n=1 Tax=Styela clava TaxID=7725 RepID=UPI0019392F36|nr:uncharacterized protein LOC120334034 [Styela clava]